MPLGMRVCGGHQGRNLRGQHGGAVGKRGCDVVETETNASEVRVGRLVAGNHFHSSGNKRAQLSLRALGHGGAFAVIAPSCPKWPVRAFQARKRR